MRALGDYSLLFCGIGGQANLIGLILMKPITELVDLIEVQSDGRDLVTTRCEDYGGVCTFPCKIEFVNLSMVAH